MRQRIAGQVTLRQATGPPGELTELGHVAAPCNLDCHEISGAARPPSGLAYMAACPSQSSAGVWVSVASVMCAPYQVRYSRAVVPAIRLLPLTVAIVTEPIAAVDRQVAVPWLVNWSLTLVAASLNPLSHRPIFWKVVPA